MPARPPLESLVVCHELRDRSEGEGEEQTCVDTLKVLLNFPSGSNIPRNAPRVQIRLLEAWGNILPTAPV